MSLDEQQDNKDGQEEKQPMKLPLKSLHELVPSRYEDFDKPELQSDGTIRVVKRRGLLRGTKIEYVEKRTGKSNER